MARCPAWTAAGGPLAGEEPDAGFKSHRKRFRVETRREIEASDLMVRSPSKIAEKCLVAGVVQR